MKNSLITGALLVFCCLQLQEGVCQQQSNEYIERFMSLREKIHDPANGYFSPDGTPYHSVETLICEAPDYGHETTSETFSYWLWLEAVYGKIAGDWQPLNDAWTTMENQIIPTSDLQPTASGYNPGSPATFAAEHPLPSGYPSPLQPEVPVGQDPVSAELTAAYGSEVYGMHWLLDSDNFYGYGNKGDGVSTPSYINTFQRGEQESVWETVPHPSWDEFNFGGQYGYLDLFIAEDQAPAQQWRYTNAPDADARAVQVIYWAYHWAQEQGLNPENTLPLDDAVKMGDFLRLAMFDKYFKPMGVQDVMGPGGSGYESAHYLMSWYYAWGGPTSTAQNWAWRIGCSHNHFGYQNPVAAYALSSFEPMQPGTPNGTNDWSTSLNRQLEFYQWLQSDEGAIAGGATNSWNGDYSPYPAGTPTFYDMAYDEHPVYHDPGSNSWFGWQAWSMERVAEYYYLENDPRAKNVMDKWVEWVKSEVNLTSDGGYEIPSELSWTGQPNTWNPSSPTPNTGLHVSVDGYTQDVGIAGCLARALTYYAAATEKWATPDSEAQILAKELLDRIWANYWEPNGLGVSNPETRGDYDRFFEQEVFIPDGWQGQMPNGDTLAPGVTFIDIRSDYRDDPDWPALEAAYNSGGDYTTKYHRFWAQTDVAVANAVYGFLFGEDSTINHAPLAEASADQSSGYAPLSVSFDGSSSSDPDNDPLTFLWDFDDGNSSSEISPNHTFTNPGMYYVNLTVTDSSGLSDSTFIEIEVLSQGNNAPVASFTASPETGTEPLEVSLDASGSSDPDNDPLTYQWIFGDNTPNGSGVVTSHTYSNAGNYLLTLIVDDGSFSDTTSTEIIVEEDNTQNCTFGTPSTGALPSANFSYNNVHVLGSGGPDLSNVSNMTINWSLQHNGLWQFSFNTTNGNPQWWVDLRNYLSHTFTQSQPDVTFSGTGIPGFDGEYWVTLDGDNFVMVSKNGGFTIYYSNSSTPPSCSNARVAEREPERNTLGVAKKTLTVYPNPSEQGNIHFQMNGFTENAPLKVKILDISGKVVFHKDFKDYRQLNHQTIDMRLKSGVYLLELASDKDIFTEKLLVK